MGGEIVSVLIPLLTTPILSAIVVVFKDPDADHDRSEWGFGAIIGVTPAAKPLRSR